MKRCCGLQPDWFRGFLRWSDGEPVKRILQCQMLGGQFEDPLGPGPFILNPLRQKCLRGTAVFSWRRVRVRVGHQKCFSSHLKPSSGNPGESSSDSRTEFYLSGPDTDIQTLFQSLDYTDRILQSSYSRPETMTPLMRAAEILIPIF